MEWCIGPPLQQSFINLIGERDSTKAVELYRERFADVGWLENIPYEGITELLEQLVSHKTPLYVATSKPHIFAQKILDHFDLSQYFRALFGSELDGTRADKSELLEYALAKSGEPITNVMVGDRSHDVHGALANGMQSIGVTYGYGSYDELSTAGAHEIVDSPATLRALLLA